VCQFFLNCVAKNETLVIVNILYTCKQAHREGGGGGGVAGASAPGPGVLRGPGGPPQKNLSLCEKR